MKALLLCSLLIAFVLANVENENVERSTLASTKIGLAWPILPQGGWANIFSLAGGSKKPTWVYTWSVWKDPNTPSNVEWVPMFWGPQHQSEFNQQAASNAFQGRPNFLGFNEPERSDQANLSPQTAVNLWMQYIQPLKNQGKVGRLGAPAVSSAPAGKAWLQQFIPLCQSAGCTIDFLPIHWYGSDGQAFINYVTDIHNTFGKPIWVTEWAWEGNCNGNYQPVYDFMGWTTSWLDSTSWVERWSWFGAVTTIGSTDLACSALITSDGQNETPLGSQYSDVGGHA